MFTLKIDEEIQLRNIHPDDAEALFALIERNRVRPARGLIPTLCPKQPKLRGCLPSTASSVITAIRLAPASLINTFTSWKTVVSGLPNVPLTWGYGFMANLLVPSLCQV